MTPITLQEQKYSSSKKQQELQQKQWGPCPQWRAFQESSWQPVLLLVSIFQGKGEKRNPLLRSFESKEHDRLWEN